MPVIRTVAAQAYPAGDSFIPDATGVNVPNNNNAKFRITTTMTQAVLDDPATRFSLGLEVLVDSIWRFFAGFTFEGGPNKGKGGAATVNPGVQINMGEVEGRTVRGKLTAENPVTLGLLIERLN